MIIRNFSKFAGNLKFVKICGNFPENSLGKFPEHWGFERNQIHGCISKQTTKKKICLLNIVFIFLYSMIFAKI